MIFSWKNIVVIFFFYFINTNISFSSTENDDFNQWLDSYKKFALKEGISKNTLDIAFENTRYLEKVIKYDRKQPEFFEDTITYVQKRASASRAKIANKLYNETSPLFLQNIHIIKDYNN